jgi:hypothetical protein
LFLSYVLSKYFLCNLQRNAWYCYFLFYITDNIITVKKNNSVNRIISTLHLKDMRACFLLVFFTKFSILKSEHQIFQNAFWISSEWEISFIAIVLECNTVCVAVHWHVDRKYDGSFHLWGNNQQRMDYSDNQQKNIPGNL